MSRGTFLEGVRRSLVRIDDDRILRRAVVEQIRRTVPFDAFAWLLTDPETTVGTAPLAEVPCLDRLPQAIALRYTAARRWTAGPPGVPYRPVVPGSEFAQFLTAYGTYDVLSITFADRFGCWAFLDLWREGGHFSGPEAELIGLLTEPVTTALRRARAATFPVRDRAGQPASSGQAVLLLLEPDLTVRVQTTQAESELRALLPTEESRRPVPAAAYNVAAQLLAVEAGLDDHRPMARTTAAPGHWISVQAARLGEDIAVTIASIAQRERWMLFCRAHGLSNRETQVVICLAEGDDTHALATRLQLSEHTVQDHLKSVFAKTSMNSRRELLACARGD